MTLKYLRARRVASLKFAVREYLKVATAPGLLNQGAKTLVDSTNAINQAQKNLIEVNTIIYEAEAEAKTRKAKTKKP